MAASTDGDIMPGHPTITMDTKVSYCKGGKRNGYLPDTFDPPGDWENDYSEEDEIFVQNSRPDDDAASKPLMYPRQRSKVKGRSHHCHCKPIVHALCCFLFLVLSLGSLMGFVVYFVDKHNKQTQEQEHLFSGQSKKHSEFSDIVGCDHIEVEDVWVVGIPKLLTESAFRMVDVNKDGTLDVIFGFATGADGYSIPGVVCDIYFGGTFPCFGGLLALDGATGAELWRHYSDHEVYALNCDADLNQDGVNDCLGGGRAGVFQAISGADGSLIWDFGKQEAKNDIMNLYTAQITRDLDNDGVLDVLAVHGGDPLQDPGSAYRLSGRIMLLSGRTGEVIQWMGVPDNKESYYSPQIYTLMDGTEMVLFGTGGETHGGSLWRIPLNDLVRGHIDKAVALFTDGFKGVMTPPVLADLNGDGTEDIIVPVFNSSVLAIDGVTLKLLWNQTFPMSESYSTPAPGFYNDDNIPDFLVKYAHGPGFPIYYHSLTTVLDGKTGRPLIEPPIRDTIGAQASSLTVSMEGRGHDLFLYWVADCVEHEGEGGEYKFVQGTNVHEQSRSDFCRLRFKTKGYSKVYVISQHIPAPGMDIYYSENRKAEEHDKWINTTLEGEEFLHKHPEYLEEYSQFSHHGNHHHDDDTGKSAADDDDHNGLPAFQREGSEAFFSPPNQGGKQRTSYKKGPAKTGYRPSMQDTIPDSRRNDMYSDYDFDPNYYKYPVEGYQKSAYKNNGRSWGGLDPYRYDDDYYHTTPPSYRDRYRGRYPGNRRTDRAKVSPGTKVKTKPIAMRKRRKLSVPEEVQTFDKPIPHVDTSNIPHIATKHMHNMHNSMHKHDKHRNNGDSDRPHKRDKRHIGSHDEKGLQRLISTGTIAPSTLPRDHQNYNHSVDFVFATYWFFPARTRAILPADQKCIEKKLSEETIRFDTNSEYYGMDHDAYEHKVTDECIAAGGHDLSDDGTYETQGKYNPFNINMGQMTIYRLRLTCTCNQTLLQAPNKRCARTLPYDQQQWQAYMGNHADSHWIPRRPGV